MISQSRQIINTYRLVKVRLFFVMDIIRDVEFNNYWTNESRAFGRDLIDAIEAEGKLGRRKAWNEDIKKFSNWIPQAEPYNPNPGCVGTTLELGV